MAPVKVRGAKNLVPKAMVASLLGDTPSVLRGVPAISDVKIVTGLLELHGVRVTMGPDGDSPDGELTLDPSAVEQGSIVDIDAHAGSSRIPILFCGPLLHRLGQAFIPDLGGCKIGDRPIDFHLEVLRQFGAVVERARGRGHPPGGPAAPARHQDQASLPICGYHGAGAAHSSAGGGRHGAQERRDGTGDHGPRHGPAEDGRLHHRRPRTGHADRGCGLPVRLPAPQSAGPQRIGVLGLGGTRHGQPSWCRARSRRT